LIENLRTYIVRNWGAPFIIAFAILIVISGILSVSGSAEIAGVLAVYSYYALAIGIVLQGLSYVKYGEQKESHPSDHGWRLQKSATRALQLLLGGIVILGLVVAFTYLSPFGSSITHGTTTNSTASSVGCSGSDGSVFIASNLNVTVPLIICGHSLSIPGGVGGGMEFHYIKGNIIIIAPLTVEGFSFKFWNVILASGISQQETNNTLSIGLTAGLSAQSSQIGVFYMKSVANQISSTSNSTS
jgi:hypothetical protein